MKMYFLQNKKKRKKREKEKRRIVKKTEGKKGKKKIISVKGKNEKKVEAKEEKLLVSRMNKSSISNPTQLLFFHFFSVVLEMQSVAVGEIVLLGEKCMKYIAMDDDGNLITTVSH